MPRLFLLVFCLVAVLLAVSAAPASAQTCNDVELDTAVQKGAELTTLLKIANFDKMFNVS